MTIEELNLLRSEDLLSLARNPVANVRHDAIRLLVERGSQYASHQDIVEEAARIIFTEPIILKKIDPASAVSAHKLPGLIDVIAIEVKKVRGLEIKACAFADKHIELETNTSKLKSLHLALEGQHDLTKQETLEDLGELFNIAEEYGKRIEAAEIRLALLERSLWRKFADWVKRMYRRARS